MGKILLLFSKNRRLVGEGRFLCRKRKAERTGGLFRRRKAPIKRARLFHHRVKAQSGKHEGPALLCYARTQSGVRKQGEEIPKQALGGGTFLSATAKIALQRAFGVLLAQRSKVALVAAEQHGTARGRPLHRRAGDCHANLLRAPKRGHVLHPAHGAHHLAPDLTVCPLRRVAYPPKLASAACQRDAKTRIPPRKTGSDGAKQLRAARAIGVHAAGKAHAEAALQRGGVFLRKRRKRTGVGAFFFCSGR